MTSDREGGAEFLPLASHDIGLKLCDTEHFDGQAALFTQRGWQEPSMNDTGVF